MSSDGNSRAESSVHVVIFLLIAIDSLAGATNNEGAFANEYFLCLLTGLKHERIASDC